MNLLLPDKSTNIKAISTALPSGLTFELADGNPREATCCSEAAADGFKNCM